MWVIATRRKTCIEYDRLSKGTVIILALDTTTRGGVRLAGRHYPIDGAKRGPAPAHHIDIWIGAYKPRMLRLTGRVADGWLPSAGYLGPEALAEANLIIDEAAEAAGRVPTDVRRLYNISGSFTGSGDFLQGPPRQWVEELTELAITEGIASTLMTSRISLRTLEATPPERPTGVEVCTQVGDVAINQVFYRKEPHMMQRFSALALDNIRRDPAGFLLASAYRVVRLFMIEGTSDRFTAQQFSGSRRIYAAATGVSIVYLALFAAGAFVGWRRGYQVGLALLLIAYIPATLAPVLTNMRYTITVQPLMFMFMAIAIAAAVGVGRADASQPFER